MPPDVTVLKRNVKRTVTLEEIAGVRRIVKRFHAPGALDRLRDRQRAHREFRTLRRLRDEGLPVPAPVEVRKRERHWELVLERIDEAASLDDLFAGRAPWPAPPERVATELGRLLGALRARGVRHLDLHAGNVLVDRAGRPHLVDLARVRFGAAGEAASEELASLAAGVRERSSPRFRTRVLLALRGSAPDLLPPLTPEVVDTIERRARVLRRAAVRTRVARYWRESGAMRPFERAGRRGLARPDVQPELLDLLATKPLTPWPPAPARAALGVDARAIGELAPRWEVAARLAMHDVPGERPLVLFTHPRPRAVFEVPREPVPLEEAWPAAPEGERALLAHEVGRVLGALDDRGLSFAPESGSDRGPGLLATPDWRVELGPGRLVDLHRCDASGAASVALGALAGANPEERRAFARGFVDAHRGTEAERAAITRELALG